MEWTVALDLSGRFARIVTSGPFSSADHALMIEDVLSQPYWRPGMATLFDHRSLDLSASTLATMREAGDNHVRENDRIGDGKAAIVMGRPADFGSARQFEALVDGKVTARLRIFLDPAEAETWLAEPEDAPASS